MSDGTSVSTTFGQVSPSVLWRRRLLFPRRRLRYCRTNQFMSCNSCGACCVQHGTHDGSAYVYLDREEARRMTRLGLPVVEADFAALCLGARPHRGAGGRPACVAFAGEMGVACGCSIYPHRPSVCREFEVGEQLCQESAGHGAGTAYLTCPVFAPGRAICTVCV